MNQETHHSVQNFHVQVEELMGENEAHDQLRMDLNSHKKERNPKGKKKTHLLHELSGQQQLKKKSGSSLMHCQEM